MKTQILNYTFDKAARTVTFNDYKSIRLDSILLITNVTDGLIVYNFADSSKGGSVSGNVLSLAFDTTGMDNSDKLQIFYDDLNTVTYGDFVDMLKQLILIMANPSTTDKTLNQIRTAPQSLPTLATCSTVTTVNTLANVDGYQGKMVPMGINTIAWRESVRNLIS
jgi:hypothetical protein